jgi:hypothetical protein
MHITQEADTSILKTLAPINERGEKGLNEARDRRHRQRKGRFDIVGLVDLMISDILATDPGSLAPVPPPGCEPNGAGLRLGEHPEVDVPMRQQYIGGGAPRH